MKSHTDSAVDILLVDDRPENLKALESILESLGHRLAFASSAEGAVAQVEARDLAVALVDVGMSGTCAFDTLEQIVANERGCLVPVIMLAPHSPHEAIRAYRAGAADFVAGPAQPELLRSKVAVFAELFRRRQHEASRVDEILDVAMDAVVVFDESETVREFNGVAARVFAMSASEAVGRPVARLFVDAASRDIIGEIRSLAERRQARPRSDVSADLPHSLMACRSNGDRFPV